MKFLKSFFVLSALFGFSLAQASELKQLEIIEVKAPLVVSIWQMHKTNLLLAAKFEAGLFDPKNFDRSDKAATLSEFVSHYVYEPNKPYQFPYILLDEVQDLKPLLTDAFKLTAEEETAKTHYSERLLEVEDEDKKNEIRLILRQYDRQGPIDRVLSEKYFATKPVLRAIPDIEMQDWSVLPAQDIYKIIRADVYGRSFFTNVARNQQEDPKWLEEYTQKELLRMHPLFQMIPQSHFPANPTFSPDHPLPEVGARMYAYLLNRHFTFPENPVDRPAWYLTHDLSIFTQGLMQSVYQTAKRIYSKTAPEDNIIIFGNTPYYIGRALKVMLEGQESTRKLIEFPFSGNPNSIRPGSFNYLPNIVTPSRFKHLQDRLEGHGFFNPAFYGNNHTYIIDVVGMGGGIIYTLDTIVDCLVQRGHNPQELLKNVSIMALNQFFGELGHESYEARHEAIIGQRNIMDGAVDVLTFPHYKEPRYKVPVEVIYTPYHETLDMGVDKFSYLLRGVPQYNAAFWHPAFDSLFTQETLANRKILMEHFDSNIRHYMAQGL